MSPPLRETTAQEILEIIRTTGDDASFNTILAEAQKTGTLAWHRTLRRYLDLLVQGGVLEEKRRDVGSVNLQQLYKLTKNKPTVYAGPKILELHGLNWSTPPQGLYEVHTDLTGLLKSRPVVLTNRTVLGAGKEDSLAFEIRRDADDSTGTLDLVLALLATQTTDLPYFLKRSDEQEIGETSRQLYQKLIQIFTGDAPADADGKTFLIARERFLQILRTYSHRRSLALLDTPGKRDRGKHLVASLNPVSIVNIAGKQLGVTG